MVRNDSARTQLSRNFFDLQKSSRCLHPCLLGHTAAWGRKHKTSLSAFVSSSDTSASFLKSPFGSFPLIAKPSASLASPVPLVARNRVVVSLRRSNAGGGSKPPMPPTVWGRTLKQTFTGFLEALESARKTVTRRKHESRNSPSYSNTGDGGGLYGHSAPASSFRDHDLEGEFGSTSSSFASGSNVTPFGTGCRLASFGCGQVLGASSPTLTSCEGGSARVRAL